MKSRGMATFEGTATSEQEERLGVKRAREDKSSLSLPHLAARTVGAIVLCRPPGRGLPIEKRPSGQGRGWVVHPGISFKINNLASICVVFWR